MTKAEFLALKDHARIKYTGTRPLSELFAIRHRKDSSGWGYGGSSSRKCKAKGGTHDCEEICDIPQMTKSFAKKGVVVSSVSEDTWSKGAERGTISLYYYGGNLSPIDPSEWTLVDARKWVEGETEFKMAKSYIKLVARRFKEETKSFLKRYKSSMDYRLDRLPLDKKLKAIMELSPEDKKWFGIMNADPDAVLALIEKAFDDEGI